MGGGGKGGGDSGGYDISEYLNKMADISKETSAIGKEIYTQASPMRQAFVDQFNRFLGVPTSATSTGTTYGTPALSGTTSPSMWTNTLTGEVSSISPQEIWKNMYMSNPYSFVDYGNNVPGGREAYDKAWQPIGQTETTTAPVQTDASGVGVIPSFLNPVMQAGKRATESQYQVALDQLLSNTPMGGGLVSSLGNLEQGRANQLADLEANVAQDLYNKAYGWATGTPQQSMSAYSVGTGALGSASQAGNQANQIALQGQGTAMGAGIGLGSLLSRGGKGAAGKGASVASAAPTGGLSLLANAALGEGWV